MCNKCNQTTNNCGCTETITQTNICNQCEQLTCDCPVTLDTDCSTYTGDDITCQDTIVVPKNTILSDALSMIVSYFCGAIEEVKKYLRLINVGTGVDIYAGDNLLGEKKIRRLNSSSPIVTVTQNTDDISIGVDEDELNDFIEANQKTYSVNNVGDGVELYAAPDTILGDNTTFNFKTLTSPDIILNVTDTEVELKLPSTSNIPALYVNNLYQPTYDEWVKAGGDLTTNPSFQYKGEGTAAKPFTDSVRYTSSTTKVVTADTSIQNALDAYVGSGTPLAPEKSGQRIIIQDNNSTYVFAGTFNYSQLYLKIEGNITSTTVGYLVDMDDTLAFNIPDVFTIDIDINRYLFIEGQGFNNSGTVVATNNYAQYKQLKLIGEGYIAATGTDITKYAINSDKDSTGNGTTGFFNDGAWQYEIRCIVSSEFQGLVAIGGKALIAVFGGTLQTGSVLSDVDVNLKAFYLKGGSLRFSQSSNVILYGSNSTLRLKGFILENTNSFTPEITSNDSFIRGNVDTLFSKENNLAASLVIADSGSLIDLYTEEIFYSPDLWSVNFKHNKFGTGNIDSTMVDLTFGNNISSVNFIGNSIVEYLVKFTSKQAAQNASLPMGSKFIKQTTVTTGSFIVGEEYKIFNVGDTDFTLIGADSNTVGEWFVATGVGGGTTGVAVKESTEVL